MPPQGGSEARPIARLREMAEQARANGSPLVIEDVEDFLIVLDTVRQLDEEHTALLEVNGKAYWGPGW